MKGTLPRPRFGIIALRGQDGRYVLRSVPPFHVFFGLTRGVGPTHPAPLMNSSACGLFPEVDALSVDEVRERGGEVDATVGSTSSAFP